MSVGACQCRWNSDKLVGEEIIWNEQINFFFFFFSLGYCQVGLIFFCTQEFPHFSLAWVYFNFFCGGACYISVSQERYIFYFMLWFKPKAILVCVCWKGSWEVDQSIALWEECGNQGTATDSCDSINDRQNIWAVF